MEENADVYKHSYTNKEIWNKEGISNKFYTIHQWRYTRYVTIKNKTSHKRAKYSFQATKLRHCGT